MYLSALSTICDKCETYCCEAVCGPWKCQSSKPILWLVYRCVGVTYVFAYICLCVYTCLQLTGENNKILPRLDLCLLLINVYEQAKRGLEKGLVRSFHCSATDFSFSPHDTVTPNQVFQVSLPFFLNLFISLCNTNQSKNIY